ncbi:MAG: hypothetical protein Q8920_07445 [Bacillota bacterium]|nr:hypothetical protein [Bacillota bacterium]
MAASYDITVLKLIDSLVYSFRIGEIKKANEDMTKFIQHLDFLMQNIGANQEKMNNIFVLNNYLKEFLSAFEYKDYVFVCDILKYCIRPELQKLI